MSQTAMNIAAIVGPMTKPLRPKMEMPPSVEISTTKSGSSVSLPTRNGRKRLSTRPMTKAPNAIRTTPCQMAPVARK